MLTLAVLPFALECVGQMSDQIVGAFWHLKNVPIRSLAIVLNALVFMGHTSVSKINRSGRFPYKLFSLFASFWTPRTTHTDVQAEVQDPGINFMLFEAYAY